MFPYHYGSHATHTDPYFLLSFSMFPYHYGSHATVFAPDTGNTAVVSIPLWFSRNKAALLGMGTQLAVSIPLWFSRNLDQIPEVLQCNRSFHTTMVLTQLEKDFEKFIVKSFHTTMVLTQLKRQRLFIHKDCGFHTTMVLTQLTKRGDIYLLGKHVSIPLWFSRNQRAGTLQATSYKEFPYHYGSHATKAGIKRVNKHVLCFHTTMVLTQHAQTKCFSPLALFPYHYGSHATLKYFNVFVWFGFPYHYGSHATLKRTTI